MEQNKVVRLHGFNGPFDVDIVQFEDLRARFVGYRPTQPTIEEETLAELRSLRAWVEANAVSARVPEPAGGDLLDVKQAGRLLHISRSHLYNLMEAGDVPYVMVGRARRVARKDLERYVAAQRRG